MYFWASVFEGKTRNSSNIDRSFMISENSLQLKNQKTSISNIAKTNKLKKTFKLHIVTLCGRP